MRQTICKQGLSEIKTECRDSLVETKVSGRACFRAAKLIRILAFQFNYPSLNLEFLILCSYHSFYDATHASSLKPVGMSHNFLIIVSIFSNPFGFCSFINESTTWNAWIKPSPNYPCPKSIKSKYKIEPFSKEIIYILQSARRPIVQKKSYTYCLWTIS